MLEFIRTLGDGRRTWRTLNTMQECFLWSELKGSDSFLKWINSTQSERYGGRDIVEGFQEWGVCCVILLQGAVTGEIISYPAVEGLSCLIDFRRQIELPHHQTYKPEPIYRSTKPLVLISHLMAINYECCGTLSLTLLSGNPIASAIRIPL